MGYAEIGNAKMPPKIWPLMKIAINFMDLVQQKVKDVYKLVHVHLTRHLLFALWLRLQTKEEFAFGIRHTVDN